MTCDHKFIDSHYCAKCGVSVGTLRAEGKAPAVYSNIRWRLAEQAVLDACWAAQIVVGPDEFLSESSERSIRKAIEAWRLSRMEEP